MLAVDEQQKRLRTEAEHLRAYARKLHEKARLLRKEAQRITDESDALLSDVTFEGEPDHVSQRAP